MVHLPLPRVLAREPHRAADPAAHNDQYHKEADDEATAKRPAATGPCGGTVAAAVRDAGPAAVARALPVLVALAGLGLAARALGLAQPDLLWVPRRAADNRHRATATATARGVAADRGVRRNVDAVAVPPPVRRKRPLGPAAHRARTCALAVLHALKVLLQPLHLAKVAPALAAVVVVPLGPDSLGVRHVHQKVVRDHVEQKVVVVKVHRVDHLVVAVKDKALVVARGTRLFQDDVAEDDR
jgi:hypothetical protein